MRALLTAALLAAAATATASLAEEVTLLEHKDWWVGMIDEEMCVANTNSGTASLSIAAVNQSVVLVFGDEQWSLTPDQTVEVLVDIDYSPWEVTATSDRQAIRVELTDVDREAAEEFLYRLSSGNALALKTVDGTRLSIFSLRGSAAATAKMIDCVNFLQASIPSSDPFQTSAAVPAVAAPGEGSVTWGTYDKEGYAWIDVQGILTPASVEAFTQVANTVSGMSYQHVVVNFASDGGNLAAGIEIGEQIRERSYMTMVEANKGCYSSCALAWLGGTQLMVTPTSVVGFHQAYDAAEGASVQGNAMVGTYIARLGYGYETTMLVTQAAPQDMLTLNAELAAEAGLVVQIVPE